jgi:hypothetical protein
MTARVRGFAAMSKDKRDQVARLGGMATQRNGTAHCFTPEEARAAANKMWAKRRAAKT